MSRPAGGVVSPRAAGRALAAPLGMLGAGLGLAAGMAELAVGPAMRSWVGDKQDTTRLGLATTALAAIALGCALALRRPGAGPVTRLALAAGLLLPGLVGFTTTGRLWYVPGALLIVAALLSLPVARGELAPALAEAGRRGTAILAAAMALLYVFLGATALGPAGTLAIAGGLAVPVLLALRGRMPRWLAVALLAAAAVPFAALTWWSVVSPLAALMLLAVGVPALVGRPAPADRL